MTTYTRAAERDEIFQAAINFIETLTGMTPPPIEVAPPEVFAPFRDFVDEVQAITAKHQAIEVKRQPLTAARIDELIEGGVFGCNPHELVRRLEEECGVFKTRPLTDEQRRQIWRDSPFRGNGGQIDWFIEGTRAAELAHGITGG